ncbi:MAG: MogA/MoaB family molybdenum cofactor biosynthesis protein [Bryobacteraceae bacterium]
MIRTAVVTISDSAVAGTREDRSGPALEKHVQELGWMVVSKKVVPDDVQQIAELLASLADGGEVDLILTTGGTGLALRDVTPEAIRTIAHREVPGFGEIMRAEGRKSARFAALSRGGAATRCATLIVNLPGSPRGAVDSLIAVADLIPHSVDLLHGRTQHRPFADGQ